MDQVHRQLPAKEVMIQGTVVDARITTSLFTPKSQPKKMAQDPKEDQREEPELPAQESDHEQPEEDRGFKKRKKTYDGYQRPMATTEKGLMLGYTRWRPMSTIVKASSP